MLMPLTSEEAVALLSERRVGHLGCIYEGGPYVVPVNYVFGGADIYIHSLPGQKLAALRANPRACLQVEETRNETHWSSAIAFGSYQEITDPAERERALHRLLARYPHLTPVESVPVHDGRSSVIVFRIRVEEVTGVGER